MRIVFVAVLASLAACSSSPPKAPPSAPVPAVVKVPVATYVPIPARLTSRCVWSREGEPSQVFAVSNGRRRCLLQYEAQFDAVEQVQGKPVPK
ncbi:hypothetical protein [Stenotrophomonas sp. CFBP 13718]|uniref:hypothetical protein n=1 Tax=Stenotrophomonas sp. CFBP 13718 TaxID=2775304 RepID=UPI00177AF6E9|nr:hypothetical protein [Stenotrophomonas sp. CFBP 13718]MBD8696586.1 hypothetical protein [Stenotrophomonas sp. CFBP 13718]